MVKQFLLNPDGSVPDGVDVEFLTEQGITLVVPTPLPREYGMIAVEQDPEQDEDGVWHQVWKLVPDQQIIENIAAFNEQQKAERAEAYRTISDPLFFKSQRGEATLEEWQAAVEEIKLQYPYITE